jgi:hypothetical protein
LDAPRLGWSIYMVDLCVVVRILDEVSIAGEPMQR